MANAYVPPGVDVTELSSPVVSPILAVPASICLVGLSAGSISRTDIITLPGTTAVTLPSVPTDAVMVSGSIISVTDAVTPSNAPNGYVVTTDYTFNASTHQITRVGAGAIPDGASVYVTYTYTPVDYFSPIRLDSMSDVQERFGPAWDSTGSAISSPLSHAAQIAFENGASNLVLQPLFYNNSGTKQQPTSTQAAAAATWTDNYTSLRDIDDINIIVPVVGQSQANVGDSNQLAIIQTLQDHIRFMKTEDQYIIGIFGEDASASSSVAQKATLLSHAATLASRYGGDVTQQMVFISPSKFSRPTPGSLISLFVGGQYVAAALAGMIAARNVSQTLTRKILSGITAVNDSRTKAEMNTDAGTGLCVIQQKGQLVLVRHAVTLDTTATVRRELSVVRSKHRVIESVRDTIDTQVIGQVVADGDAPDFVRNAVVSVLEALHGTNDLVEYSDVQARTLTIDPTVIEVRFSYRPAFPVNYVHIIFSLDLTNKDIAVAVDTTQVNSGVAP